jgi:anti-sigma-K factor RskA
MTTDRTRLSCDDASELAGLYVLDALEPAERDAVADHLAACTARPHEEFAELGSVVPAVALAAEPMGAPAALKQRVLDAYRAETAPAASAATPWATKGALQPSRRQSRLPAWPGWAAAAAALLVVAVVGAWGLDARADADRANQRATDLSNAIAAMSARGSSVAILHGSGPAATANGFAAFPPGGGVHVVLTDVPSAPAGMAYQAWYIADGTPTSAGLMTVGADGYVIMSDPQPVPGTEVFAVTVEPAGGSAAPTSDPIVVGELTTPA